MTIYRAAAIAAVSAAMAALTSGVSAHAQPTDLGCHQATSAIEQMHDNLPFPKYFSDPNPTKQGGEFDANRTFTAFPHLKMREGYTLDYVYHQDRMGGHPVLYARPADQRPYANEAEYDAAPKPPDYLTYVTPEDSAQGYLELAILSMTAGQFYLDWHANYNDWMVLCSTEDIEGVIQSISAREGFGTPMTDAQKQAARAIPDPQPTVALTDDTATVTMLVFTKWGGFSRRTVTINHADHSILNEQDKKLVEYDCSIRL